MAGAAAAMAVQSVSSSVSVLQSSAASACEGASRRAAGRSSRKASHARSSFLGRKQPVVTFAAASVPKKATRKARVATQNIATEPIAPNTDRELQCTREEGLVLYEDMYLGRQFEEVCAMMYYRGKMFGFVHLYSGQEAVSTGILKAMRADDYACSTYRDHVHALSKGVPAKEIMAELFGKVTGCCKGMGGSMHIFSKPHNFLGGFAFIGEGIPVATGAAMQVNYRRDVLGEKGDQVVACFFGDGTANNGAFYECLNMAALWKLPIMFVVENNLWAIGMSHYRATSVPEIWKKGEPFGIPGVHVDGMDVLKVREVAKEAVARARAGEGPTLIECETYRFRGHSLADPDELRSKDEKAHYAKRDPIPKLKNYLIENGLATEGELADIEKKIDDELEEAVEFADKSEYPPKDQLWQHVFPDPRGFGIDVNGEWKYKSFSKGRPYDYKSGKFRL
eukprot:jgi/Chlat1/6667/Chrsp49S06155